MSRRLRLSIVIAHQRRGYSAVAAFQPGDIAIQRQVFSMLVMPAVADHVSGIVQKRARLQQHSRMRQHMMYGLQLIEKLDAQFPDVLRVPTSNWRAAAL